MATQIRVHFELPNAPMEETNRHPTKFGGSAIEDTMASTPSNQDEIWSALIESAIDVETTKTIDPGRQNSCVNLFFGREQTQDSHPFPMNGV